MSKTLKLLDIDEFIRKNNLKEIKSGEIFLKKTNVFHPEGVYSEEIFGKLGTKKREETWAYIDLKGFYIHPAVIDILKFFIPKFNDVLIGKKYVTINDKGVITIIDDKDKDIDKIELKFTGVKGIYELFNKYNDKINWDIYKKKDKDFVKFIQKNLDKCFIDKWLVLPAGIREIQEINNQYQEQEISKEYRKLVYLVFNKNSNIESTFTTFLTGESNKHQIETDYRIQMTLDKIFKFITVILRSKSGIVRGAKLSKRVDHVARLVLGHDSDLQPDEVGVPWFILLKLYEPYVMYYIAKDDRFYKIKENILEIYNDLSINTMRDYLTNIVNYPDTIDKELKELFLELLDIIINGKEDKVPKYVMVIRHPVENRDSILGLKPKIIEDDVYVARLPQVLFSSIGGDCSNDIILTYSNNGINEIHLKDIPKKFRTKLIEKRVRLDGIEVEIRELLDSVKILSYNREDKRYTWDKIVLWHEHKNIKMNKVILEDGTEFIMSPSKETLVTINGEIIKPVKENIGKEILKTITLEDVKILDNYFDGIFEEDEKPDKYIKLLRMLGLLLSDGSVTNTDISFSNNDRDLLREYENLVIQIFPDRKMRFINHKGSYKNNEEYAATSMRFTHTEFSRRLRKYFGFPAPRKIPNDFYNLSDYAKALIISGIIDGDGTIFIGYTDKNKKYKRSVISIQSTSKDLINFVYYCIGKGDYKILDRKTVSGKVIYQYRVNIPKTKYISKIPVLYYTIFLINHSKKKNKILLNNRVKSPFAIRNVIEDEMNIGWDISTYETGTYVDKYGYVKKQCDGDMINIYAVHTKQAIEELKSINPVDGKGKFNITNYNALKVDPSMDMALGIWMLTKNS